MAWLSVDSQGDRSMRLQVLMRPATVVAVTVEPGVSAST